MSFLIQRAAGRNLTLTQIPGSVLRIGRGTNQELRSENPAVALEHAVIESDAAGYVITDKGSITGTYVNRKPVETARLSKGDTIEIGDLRIDVQIADPSKPLFLRITASRAAAAGAFDDDEEEAHSVATPGARVVRAKKIDYVAAYRLHRPWLTKLSVTAILLIVALAVIGEVIRPEKQSVFMPGGLSSAHMRLGAERARAVAQNCDACHTPWKSVASSKCASCHGQPPHAVHAASEPDCFACHAEHRGEAKLADLASPTCVQCHRSLEPHMRAPRAELASLRFAGGRYSFEQIARIDAFGASHPEFAYPADANSLRFNHKLHLAPKGIFNASGRREVLQCTGCHELQTVRGKTEPAPVDFEKHCQSCHRLTFDSRFPTAEIPHGGDPATALGYVISVYSGNRELAGKSPSEVRRILAERRRVIVDDRAVVAAQQTFRFKCSSCHEVRQSATGVTVVPPVMRATWLPNAKFTHGRHRNVECERCHENVRASVLTSDVLMPRRENCTGCHAAGANVTAASSCVTCHEYHLRPGTRQVEVASLAQAGMGGLGSGGRMLQGILLAVIVILLLVVLVPVGIALFQRLRPEKAAAAPASRPAPPPIPQRPVAEKTTDRIERQPAAAPPDLTPRAAEPEATRIMPIEKPRPAADAPQATEMVQWNGLLNCTSGPLEGQRFVIDDAGFYIGRDPALSKVVVADSRVSKRHVRIVPRDGKVWAIDEGSTNGTFLKGERITEVQLKRGDTLVLGDGAATFVYQI